MPRDIVTIRRRGGYFVPATAGGAVNFEVAGLITFSGAVTSYDYTGLTIPGGLTNSALIAFMWRNIQENFNSVIWDPAGTNQSLTFIGRVVPGSSQTQLELWGLRSPTAGNLTLRSAITTSDRIYACAAVYSGVNQVSIAAAFPNFISNKTVGAGNSDTTLTASVTSAVGHQAVAAAVSNINADAVTMNQTTIDVNVAGNFPVVCNRAAGAASVVMTIGAPTLGNLGIVGVDIAP